LIGENLSLILEDQFELLMDRLEKESYFQVGFYNYIKRISEVQCYESALIFVDQT
jgi:hypothetical protein